ncbi:hypothetical protein [Frigoriflavimonas asaccharolytica]|uniref:Uncharacterized protein n=1 Tax=Frigoriflavimonas asaccharolytica TaxID=2735899 RepID=A0A8J8K881_9FLAO|nr:hypothetical protein [Frigoriflavimonas asaccharolytica]NRS91682.1 hypothetical protein [Frigoriflavimonas asaccharolytica]
MKLQNPKFFDFKFKLMNKNVLLILFFVTVLVQCARSSEDSTQDAYNPQLPAITTTGANTFGCKINGVVMVPRNSIGYIPPGSNHYPIIVAGSSNNEYLYIQAADKRETKRGGVFIYLQNLSANNYFQTGEYEIYDGISPSFLNDNYNNYIYITAFKDGVVNNYKSIAGTGKIVLLKNDNAILSGTFFCKARNVQNPNDIIDITDGRFDFGNTINSTNFP